MQILSKAVPESLFRLTDFTARSLMGFRKPLGYCESDFRTPLHKAIGMFQIAKHDCENTFILINNLSTGFHN
jgi:hypothetical protein